MFDWGKICIIPVSGVQAAMEVHKVKHKTCPSVGRRSELKYSKQNFICSHRWLWRCLYMSCALLCKPLFIANLKLCPKDKQENTPGQVNAKPVLICAINVQVSSIWQLRNEPVQNYSDRMEEAAGKEQPGTNTWGVIPVEEYRLIKDNLQK